MENENGFDASFNVKILIFRNGDIIIRFQYSVCHRNRRRINGEKKILFCFLCLLLNKIKTDLRNNEQFQLDRGSDNTLFANNFQIELDTFCGRTSRSINIIQRRN